MCPLNRGKSIAAFKQASILDPTSASAYGWLGISYDYLKMYTEAISAYNQAIRIEPDNAGIYASLGWIYISMDMYEKALAPLLKAIELKPDAEFAHGGLCISYFTLSGRDINSQHYSNGLKEYRILQKLAPESTWTNNCAKHIPRN